MKNMKTKVIAIMLIVVMALTGCMNMNVDFVINSDGSGSYIMLIRFEKEAWVDYLEKAYASNGETLTEKDVKEIESSMLGDNFQLVTIDGKEYYQQSETVKIKKGELQKKIAGDDKNSYVTTDTVYLVINYKDELKELRASKDYQELLKEFSLDSVEFIVTMQLPKPIVNTNGTIDKENPNKATFTLALDKNNLIFATTKKNTTITSVKNMIQKDNTVTAPKITKLKANKVKKKAKKATATLKFKKVKGIKKYQIEYSTKKNFKVARCETVKKNVYTIKKLKKGKKYYVRVRAVKTNSVGVTVYSKWVKKSVKTKK
ncbi:MAG: fibronectin type III domain-containing protein [Lachnospiraceae bacterium]|nr:fibronectin type III domain-containing protein [Lachnospiraceae bacterium]